MHLNGHPTCPVYQVLLVTLSLFGHNGHPGPPWVHMVLLVYGPYAPTHAPWIIGPPGIHAMHLKGRLKA